MSKRRCEKKKSPQPERRFRFLLIALITIVVAVPLILLFTLGDNDSDETPAAERIAPRVEFERIAQRLYDGSEMFGRGKADEIRRTRAGFLDDDARWALLTQQLVNQLLQDGDPRAAVAEADALIDRLRTIPGALEQVPEFLRTRALAYLRLAEVENCINRHNADCCLYPLAGGGVHELKGPAVEARRTYAAFLQLRPDDLGARWLLNLSSMAVGDYPQAVPKNLLIPSSTRDSGHDVGRFRDVAPDLGVDTFNLCGGCILDDFDGDGRLDIVTSTIDPSGPLTYYGNTGAGTFEDRSAGSRLDEQLGGLNIIGGDYDEDGDVDVFVLRGAWLFDEGRIRNSLLRNDGPDGFVDVTYAAGLADPAHPTQAAAWGDFDGDGDLDLYVGNESRADLSMFPIEQSRGGDYPSQLFRNDGDGTFTDVAPAAGVTNDRYCKGVSAGDYDNDGDLDLYVSNIGRNRLYRNAGDGTFADVASQMNVAEPSDRSFATWFFDYDNDGWLDIFVTAYDASIDDLAADSLGLGHDATSPRLYRNNGGTGFEDVSEAVGLDRPFLPMGANFGDIDNDGWLDIYLTMGEPSYEAVMPNVMLRNDGGRRFQDVSRSGGFGHLQKGHGVAFADVDDDGDQDVYHQLGGFFFGDAYHNALFLNPGHANHFLTLELVGTQTNRSGYGARIAVEVETPSGPRVIHRAVGSVSSFGGSPRRQEIGLGDATSIKRVEIVWPRSAVQVLEDVPLDAWIEVTEGEEGFRRRELTPIELDA